MQPEPPAGGSPDGTDPASTRRRARSGSNRMLRPPHPGRVRNPVWYALVHQAELAGHEAAGDVRKVVPAWRRSTRGEHRWPVTISVIIAIVLQRLLPDQLALRPLPTWLLPVLEGGVLVGLVIANPVRIERRGVFVRWVSIVLILLITTANAASAVLLIRQIIRGGAGTGSAGPLLASGAAIWATNVIAFALWYWEFDRGGPVHRAHGTFQYLDFLFPQMTIEHLTAPGLGAAVRGLPVPVVHQRHRVQPDRRHAAGPLGQADHAGPVGGVARRWARWSSPAR